MSQDQVFCTIFEQMLRIVYFTVPALGPVPTRTIPRGKPLYQARESSKHSFVCVYLDDYIDWGRGGHRYMVVVLVDMVVDRALRVLET